MALGIQILVLVLHFVPIIKVIAMRTATIVELKERKLCWLPIRAPSFSFHRVKVGDTHADLRLACFSSIHIEVNTYLY